MAWTENTLPHDVMGVGTAVQITTSSSEAERTGILNSFLLAQSSAVR